jgi:hypothetical protein
MADQRENSDNCGSAALGWWLVAGGLAVLVHRNLERLVRDTLADTNISLITRYVTDRDAAKKFYTEHLGFVEGTDITLGDGHRLHSVAGRAPVRGRGREARQLRQLAGTGRAESLHRGGLSALTAALSKKLRQPP